MAILNPEHLLEQADKLIAAKQVGAPRQVDLRRAISAAYYSVFHATLAATADEFVGVTHRGTSQYALAYRSVEHRRLRDLCEEARRPTPRAKYHRYVPAGHFGTELTAFASAVVELQEMRHAADYDPVLRVSRSEGRVCNCNGTNCPCQLNCGR